MNDKIIYFPMFEDTTPFDEKEHNKIYWILKIICKVVYHPIHLAKLYGWISWTDSTMEFLIYVC